MVNNETLSMLANLIVRGFSHPDSFSFYMPEELKTALGNERFDGEQVFYALANLNIESLKQRYSDYDDMVGEVEYLPNCDIWKPEVFDWDNGITIMEAWHYQVLKSLDCYLYQCCEGECDELPLYKAIDVFCDKWSWYIAHNQVGYELADWK